MNTKLRIALVIMSTLAYQFAQGQYITIKEARYKGKPIIEMSINNKKTWVLLDTGSDYTVFNTHSKDDYAFTTSLSNEPELKVQGLGSENNQLHRVQNASLKFGEKRLWGAILAFDITNVAKSIHARTGKMITAIVGTNMMRNYGFIIDMGSGTVTMPYKEKKKDRLARIKILMTATESKSNANEN